MSTTNATILCGACKSPAEAVPNPEPHDKVVCTGCGREDRFDDVMRSVRDYVTDCAAKSLNATLAEVAGRSKFIKVDKQFNRQSSFRWVSTDLGI